MTRRTRLWAVGLALGLGAAWYYFRPERAFFNRRVDEPAPATAARVLLTGWFEPRAHEGQGVAQVVEVGAGELMLRLTEFATLNGPDLQVYLLGSPAVSGKAELAASGYVSLGALKGNVGDQNYAIPSGTDLDRYGVVAIWCRRFGVNFTTAPLAAAERPSS